MVSTQKGYILVEGKGEEEAAHNLVTRLSREVGLTLPWTKPRRWPNLHQWAPKSGKGGLRKGAELIRPKPDARALLILRDEDDACPREIAPRMADHLRSLDLPFPTAYVLLHPEYEVLFLPCLAAMGLPPWDAKNWEARRGIKEWLSARLPRGRIYKPTVNQLPWTQKIDFETLRRAEVPCFGTLERSLRFFAGAENSQRGTVYPVT